MTMYTKDQMSGHESLPYYRQDTKQVLAELESHQKHGLTYDEATKRLERYGPNKLQEQHKKPLWLKYLYQYKDLMILLLVASVIISLILHDVQTAVALIALILFNTVIGFTQEFKAEQLMESLERLVVTEAKVIRDGNLATISATNIVPGDIVYIEEGDSIPADLRLLQETELATNDFALTGESNPSRKFTHGISGAVELANRHNLVFMGTTVATGNGYGVVVGTGMQTELGRIASLSADTITDVSPLQRELNHIAARVTQGTVLLCVVLLPFIIYLGLGVKTAFLYAIAIASSIIPQGLPAEINTALARAASKLAKTRALVKRLSAVETLGATTIICTDKTGTLTKNQMTVEHLLIGHQTYGVTGSGYEPGGTITSRNGKVLEKSESDDLSLFFTCGVFASNARITPPDNEHAVWYTVGDPTEGALLALAHKAGIDAEQLDDSHKELKEFTFDSARKRMSSIRHYGPEDQLYVFVKGAPESILHRCEDIWTAGHVRSMTKKDRDMVDQQNYKWAGQAYRNLGYAFKVLPKGTDLKKLTMEQAESGLIWLGMVGMMDPLRDEVPAAMKAAHNAHIKVSIITGDFALTAQAIAKKAGLGISQDIIVVSGEELRQLDDSRVLRLATRGSVIFSRVSPEDKLRIVNLIKDNKKVVAVTGDGINDAPALKRADIGVAMGKTGTDVAKESAEIVLLDDSFSTLVGAIQQGRVIYQNIKKATLSCFTSNAAELVVNILSLGVFAAFGVPLSMSVMQILAIDMIAELFPIAALGWDQADGELMHDTPRKANDHILNNVSILDLLWCGLLIGGLAFTNYLLFFSRHHVSAVHADILHPGIYIKATTLTYLTIVLCQLFNILQRRSRRGLFTRWQFHNRALAVALSVSLLCVFNIIYNPWLNHYFGAGPLMQIDWLYALGAAAIFIGVRELQRHANTHHTREHILALLENRA